MKEEAGLVRPSIDIIFISSLGLWRWSAGHIALSTPECTKFTCITQDGFYIILILLYSIIFKIFKAGNFLAILLVLNDIIFMPLYYIECLLLIDFFKISSNWPLKNFVSYILLPFSKVFFNCKDYCYPTLRKSTIKITEHMFNSYSGLCVGHIPQKSFKTLTTQNDLQRK